MKVLKQESEAIQQIAKEAISLLKQAYEKLGEAYDNEGIMHVNTMEAGECIIHATTAIESAAGWLNKEPGAEAGVFIPALDSALGEANFDF